jgi:hypothetical protein
MVVSEEQARIELGAWLDYQGIPQEQRIDLKETINKLVKSICDGNIILKENNVICQKLKFPLGKEIKLTELNYQPNITVGDVQKHLTGTDPKDRYVSVYAHIAASTGESKSVIADMNMKDYNIADSIILFFML